MAVPHEGAAGPVLEHAVLDDLEIQSIESHTQSTSTGWLKQNPDIGFLHSGPELSEGCREGRGTARSASRNELTATMTHDGRENHTREASFKQGTGHH